MKLIQFFIYFWHFTSFLHIKSKIENIVTYSREKIKLIYAINDLKRYHK